MAGQSVPHRHKETIFISGPMQSVRPASFPASDFCSASPALGGPGCPMGANQKSLTNKPSRAPRDLGETPAEVPRPGYHSPRASGITVLPPLPGSCDRGRGGEMGRLGDR